MRDTKFRGRTKAGEWLYGYLMQMHSPGRLFIGTWHKRGGGATVKDELFCSYLEVIPETVGEYTGLHDKNGKEIYEGDVTTEGVVVWRTDWTWDSGGSSHPGFYFEREYLEEGELDYIVGFDDEELEVIGNIHENPELLNPNRKEGK